MADIYGQLVSSQLENLAADPANQPLGRVYFNTVSNQSRIYNGTVWQDIGSSFPAGQVPGTATNDDAAAGNVGEWISSGAQNAALTTATSVDIANITLSPGDWDISFAFTANLTSGPITGSQLIVFVGTASGNNTTGLVAGDNDYRTAEMPSSTASSSAAMAAFRVSTAGSPTLYLKCLATFTLGTMDGLGRISARRMR